MTQTVWAHLPNAKHIDWVLASLNTHPEKWDAAFDAARDAAREAARNAAFDAARDAANNAAWFAAREAAYNAVWDAAWNAARTSAYDAIVALVAYDDCAYMIESEVDEIKILAKLGDQRAILLLPACIVFNETKALTNASIAV